MRDMRFSDANGFQGNGLVWGQERLRSSVIDRSRLDAKSRPASFCRKSHS